LAELYFGFIATSEGNFELKSNKLLLFLGLTLFTVVNLTPIIWTILTSLKQPVDAFAIPPKLIFSPTFAFHREIWIEKGFFKFFLNSAIISICTVLTSVPIGTLAAYALSRIRTRHTRKLLFGLLAVRMFPHMLLAIPFFVMAKALYLFDTYLIMILSMVALNQPFTIWLMRGFFLDVPIELDEAARVDGCNPWQTFFKVILPVVRPGLVVTSLFSLLLAYNEFLFPLVLTGTRTKPLPVAISEYGGEDITYWSLSAAGATGIMFPIILFMIFTQRSMIKGLSFGAVKG
jgi:multiple sugar transport system permease protein